jgi:O-antigen ligase
MESLPSGTEIPVAIGASAPHRSGALFRTAAPIGLGILFGIILLVTDWRAVTVVLIALGLCALIFRHPFAAVLTYLTVTITSPEEMGLSPVVFRLQLVFALVCLAALTLPGLVAGHPRRWTWSGTDKALALLFLAACFSVPLAASRTFALIACWELAKVLFSYWIVRQAAVSYRRLRAVAWTMLGATSFIGLGSLWAWSTGKVFVGEAGVVRLEGLTSSAGNPNTLANTLVAGFPLMVLLAAGESKWRAKLLLLAMAGFTLLGAALTGARAAIVSLMLVVLLLVLTSKRKALATVALAGLLTVLWLKLPSDLRERYLTLRTYRDEVTYQMRAENAASGFQMLLDHPLTGVGLSCFATARVEQYNKSWVSPHDVYAQVASEMGLFGLIAFAWFLLSVLKTCVAARRRLRHAELEAADRCWLDRLCTAIMIMLAALMVQGLAGGNLSRWHWYLGAALATNCLQLVAGPLRSPSAEVARVSGQD